MDPLNTGNPIVASAMDMAMRWLEVRGRSRVQIEARLRQAGFPPAVAQGVAARLVELGILSDRAFALAGVETGLRRGLARAYLQHQLECRGVEPQDATSALEEAGNQEPDEARALRLAEAWVRAHPLTVAGSKDVVHPSAVAGTGNRTRAFRRLGAMLARKGYDEELIGEVCRAVLGEPSGLDPDLGIDLDGDVRPVAASEGDRAAEPAPEEGAPIDPPWGRS